MSSSFILHTRLLDVTFRYARRVTIISSIVPAIVILQVARSPTKESREAGQHLISAVGCCHGTISPCATSTWSTDRASHVAECHGVRQDIPAGETTGVESLNPDNPEPRRDRILLPEANLRIREEAGLHRAGGEACEGWDSRCMLNLEYQPQGRSINLYTVPRLGIKRCSA